LPNVLTADEVAILKELRAQGLSVGEISRLTHRSKSTVHRYIGGQAHASGAGQRDLAARVERLEGALSQILFLLSARCCDRGGLGLLVRCSCCGRELLVLWKGEPGKEVLEGEVTPVWA
jgi:hypothetical protein